MKHLGYISEREMLLSIGIANQELAPTIEFCNKHQQCFFQGRYRFGKTGNPFQLLPLLACAACQVPPGMMVYINSPESATALEFHTWLTTHYSRITVREKPKAAHKNGRPKSSKKGGAA